MECPNCHKPMARINPINGIYQCFEEDCGWLSGSDLVLITLEEHRKIIRAITDFAKGSK
jgi:hypothetical protein